MEIYLVRHTETVCEKGICYGQADVGLLEPYQEQFQIIKEQLPQDAVWYSSTLQRCTVLADYLSNSNFTKDDRLMEMDFGSWELKKWDEISESELTPWMQDFVNVQVPDGESFVELYGRVVAFIQQEAVKKTTKPIVIVAHAGVIRSILCYATNLELKAAFQNKVEFGSVSKVNL